MIEWDTDVEGAKCVNFAGALLEASALQWFIRQSNTPTGIPDDWDDFVLLLQRRFCIADPQARARDALKTIK